MTSDTCIHVANLFYVASYLCRDILWLRLWTCCGLVFSIVFFCTQSSAMFAPATWMSIFLGVNAIQIARTVSDRRHMKLTPRQEQVGALMLHHLSRNELLNILTISMCESRCDANLLEEAQSIDLNPEQQIVRSVAFEHLSQGELINLIVRRFWRTLARRKTRRFLRRLKSPATSENQTVRS